MTAASAGMPALHRLILRLLDAVPGSVTGRLRTNRLAPVVATAVSILTRPLHGTPVPIRRGAAAGIVLHADARSLAWITGRVESDVQRALRHCVRPGGVLFDVGASIGFFTVLGSYLVGDTGVVVAFEPQPASLAAIRHNLGLNGRRNAVLVQKAVSSSPGVGFLESPGTATASLADDRMTQSRDALRVDVTSIDEFVAQHPGLVPTVVKIDVEGHEARVLRGMTRTLAEHRPIVIVELHDSVRDSVTVLERSGYALTVLEGSPRGANAGPGSHVLAVPA